MDQTTWEYDEQRRAYTRHIGQCLVRIWQDSSGQWASKIESGRRTAVRNGFTSLDETQAWSEREASNITAVDRRHRPRV